MIKIKNSKNPTKVPANPFNIVVTIGDKLNDLVTQ